MPDLALLNSELEDIVAKRSLIREKHKGATMPEEARIEDESYTDRARKIKFLILEQQQNARDDEFTKLTSFIDDPQRTLPHGFAGNGETDDVKRLLNAGWETKNGILYAPTSTGKMQAMYPEEVLYGPLPTGAGMAETRNYFAQTRATFRPEYRNAWVNWIKNFPFGDSRAFSMLDVAEQKALSEGVDASGGYVVPPDVQAELGGRRAQQSVMRGLATVRQTNRDLWQMPMVAPHATAADRNIYSDGFVGAWVGETPTQADIDVTFEMFSIPIRKVRAKTTLSNDLIADSVVNIIGELTQRGARNLALVEDKGFIAGSGVANEPLGILNHPLALTAVASDGMYVDVEGSVSNAISNSVTDAGSAPKIKAMAYSLPSQYAENATWLMRRGIQGDIAALVDANGRPFWNSYLESGFARPALQIEGSPVKNSEFMGTDGSVSTTAATIPLLLADFREYYIIERTGFSVRILNERYADTDQTGLIIFARVGGGLWNYDAFRTGVIAS
jgi:HK97 family phage major capsid protein